MDGRNAHFICRPSFIMQCLCITGDLGNWPWCLKGGIKLHFKTVQGLGVEKARRASSSSEWALCGFKAGLRTHTQVANRALCETFGSVTICAFDAWGFYSWPHWGKHKRACFFGYFPRKTKSPRLPEPINWAAFENTISDFPIFPLLWMWL